MQELLSRAASQYSRFQTLSKALRSRYRHCLILLPMLLGFCALSSRSICQSGGSASNPVILGDHPDPTVIRVGKTYWTASTSGDWAPEFPLYRSTDLHHWTAAGAIFPKTPAWATGNFWAPELVRDGQRVLVFYVAHKRQGPLCVAVATASQPEGPYQDYGPLLCQPDGSIDPAFMRDEHGKPFLIWKEDGNSIHKPTPIFAQPLSSDLLHLTGEPTQLIVNDPESWEGGVVEAPYLMRHGGRFFLFYAGNACCGTGCRYAEGVARAEHLLGPWEKNPKNPIIAANKAWKCPGHGTAVRTPAGKDFFLYHAYPAVGTIYLGRESVLDPIAWDADGWPSVNGGNGTSGGEAPGVQSNTQRLPRQISFTDKFGSGLLGPEWKWPVDRPATVKVGKGRLFLQAEGEDDLASLAGSLLTVGYISTVGVEATSTAAGGLAVIGNRSSTFALTRRGGTLQLLSLMGKAPEILWQTTVSAAPVVWLRVSSDGSTAASFSYSLDHQKWIPAGDPLSVAKLPPWDQGLRIGLVAQGLRNTGASFVQFSLLNSKDPELASR